MANQISFLEQEALDFIIALQHAYFERRDLSAVLSSMESETSWIGTGLGEGCSCLEEALSVLTKDFQEYPGHFSIAGYHYLTQPLSETVCLVHGELVARPENPKIADQMDRISAVCVKTPGGMKLAHLHISHPSVDQEPGQYYARREVQQDREAFQSGNTAASRRLEAQGRELALLTENVPGGIYQCKNDPDYSLISVSSGFLSLIGCTRKELRDQYQDSFAQIILPDDLTRVRQTLHGQCVQGDILEVEYRIRLKGGEIIWVLDQGRRMVMPDGTDTFYCILLDITAQRKARDELRLSLEKYRIIMDQATDIIFEWDICQDRLIFSQNWRKKFGYDPISQDISRRIPFSENIHPEDMPAFVKLMEDTAHGVPYSETEFRIRNILREFTWCRIRATAQYDNAGKAIKAVGVILDIDEDKKLQQRLRDQAQRDGLTGLLNKETARQAVESAIQIESDGHGVLLIIDLDDFKGINDRYGHLAGDTVLSDASLALKKLFRSNDVLARIGGDEFLVYMPGAPAEEAERKAQSIIRALKQISVFDQTGLVSCSVGAAVLCKNTPNFIELYRCADMALYQVKNTGKGSFFLHSSELCAQIPDDNVIRTAVNTVIDSDSISATLGEYCFRLLYRAIDPLTAVNQILELIGRAYDVSRVYIFESSEDGLRCSNTFEWCNEGISPEIDRLQDLAYADLDNYPSYFNEDGIFYCADIRQAHPNVYGVLSVQGIRSMLQCAIMDDGQFKGYVGFGECRENRLWTKSQIDTLSLVSNVLSTFLMHLRLKERMARLTEGAATARP